MATEHQVAKIFRREVNETTSSPVIRDVLDNDVFSLNIASKQSYRASLFKFICISYGANSDIPHTLDDK